jgi:hypothetical protein
VTAPLTQREFVEWFRDSHIVDGMRLKYIMTHDAEVIDLDLMSDDQAQAVAEELMMMDSQIKGHA